MKAPIQRFLFSGFGFLALHPYSSPGVNVDSPVKSSLLILEGSWLHVCNWPGSDVSAAELWGITTDVESRMASCTPTALPAHHLAGSSFEAVEEMSIHRAHECGFVTVLYPSSCNRDVSMETTVHVGLVLWSAGRINLTDLLVHQASSHPSIRPPVHPNYVLSARFLRMRIPLHLISSRVCIN